MNLTVVVTQKGAIFDGKAPAIIQSALDSAMSEAVALLEREVKARTPQGVFGVQGAGLRASVHGEIFLKGTPAIKGIIAHQSKYGDVIEKGRTAGKTLPPPGSLLRWIEVKLGVGEKKARQLEFVIRRKIGKKGFEGAHMFEKALSANEVKLMAIFDRAGFNIARRLNGE
jgi:hypothetical protein